MAKELSLPLKENIYYP